MSIAPTAAGGQTDASAEAPDNEHQPIGSDAELRQRLRAVPLEQRIRLLTGATPWALHEVAELDLGAIVVSDGPIGVRGVDEELTPSAQLPSPSALAATWNPQLAADLGALVAREAKRKNVDVVLAPVVNLQRTPVGGRHFECFSEDPLLTTALATPYIDAIQRNGVAACVKHYVGNESETDRTSYIARIDERALREVYLAPFEALVRDVGVWCVMAAYNRIDDGTESNLATEHAHLLVDVLKNEWGFDGVVVSDWLATQSTVASANAGLDLVMPGPGGPWEQNLLDAVRSGQVSEDTIDDKIERMLRLAERVGAIGREASVPPGVDVPRDGVDPDTHSAEATRALLREAVARSIVVLRNDGVLPLATDSSAGTSTDGAAPRRIALLGPNVVDPFIQGGGSAFVHAPYATHPADAVRAAFPAAQLTVSRGGSARAHAPGIDPALVETPDGEPGYELTLLDDHGSPLGDSVVAPGGEAWNRHVDSRARSARVRARVRLAAGTHRIDVGTCGAHSIRFNDEIVSESDVLAGSEVILNSSANNPDGPARLFARDVPFDVHIDARLQVVHADGYGTFVRFALRHEPDALSLEEEIADAVAAASDSDVALVIVGTNEETESEGWDRQNIDLPGRQDDMVRAVAATGTPTIVIVNAGGPVLLPWIDDVSAVLWWWLPGQEGGTGLVDALTGRTEPAGRLPWTLPARLDDCPVPNAVPIDGIVDYAEGVHVGYRGWLAGSATPAREFGFGLGYGTWRYSAVREIESADGDVRIEVELQNIGDRSSCETVQAYIEDASGDPSRPVRWLGGFAQTTVAAGATGIVDVRLPRRVFETWNVATSSWEHPLGPYRIRVGSSSTNLPLEITLTKPHRPLGRNVQGGTQ
ncbi:beta-glucosidase family protein [Paramicrobacterium fandaimingii]|uniref:beta-glucosidase family protein n=1 Tax=Paramicrobacterium fandaimingii TaxID=2708079 RepID=UPI001F20AE20|nr:glycoside hydrolase family 3 protein [Microbacterium fandaimingii]